MTLILFGVFAVTLIIGVPIAITMGLAGLLAILVSDSVSPLIVTQNMFSGLDSFPLLAIPFFLLAAELMTGGAITDVLLKLAVQVVGHVRGGLGHANILTLTFFSGISGSALADAAGPGSMLIRMMRETGYAPAYAAALTASTAIIGPIIPPSIIMIIYALTDNSVSVTGLFMAGIVPGLMIALALVVVNHWVSRARNYRVGDARPTARDFLGTAVRAVPALLLPFIIIGGIHSGVFTPTEASAVAVFYALVVGRFVYGSLTFDKIPAILVRTALMTSSVLLIVSMSAVFAWVLTVAQVPQAVATAIGELGLGPIPLLLVINIFLLIFGIFMEPLPGVMILVPILAPLAEAAGIHPLQFAIVVIVNLTLGMITPPVGALLFVTSIVSKVPMGPMVRELWPMLAAQLIVLLLLVLVPGFSTWLPALFGYQR